MYDDAINHRINASYLAMPVFLAVTVPVLWRRAAPTAALAVVLVALLVHIALFGTITRCGVVFPVIWVLVFAAGARLELRPALIALALGLGAIAVMASSDSQINLVHAAPFGALSAIVWGVGRLARSRSRMTAELHGRTDELRKARDECARLEVATDRARLSGELDELLHERLGELARLADAGAHDVDPASATRTLAGIERTSRQTLEEIRALVGVLRRPEENGGLITPQPTLMSLDALILKTTGADAHLTVEGSPQALPAGVELSAYRIVEHLLGALDDAPGVDVRVRFGDNLLEVAVSGAASRRREIASAIERARERAQLHRGKLEATVSGGRARAVAELPLTAGA
jgi:signal transduction histidine kinase